ncbi:MAG: aminotransferase class V-fold PLP-dependent enzyme [Defluviitaleaceae bacterium]|nr:aminotransferase class V-fold PLP-dependent enzyme [Defluviitaleaceae bacterium]
MSGKSSKEIYFDNAATTAPLFFDCADGKSPLPYPANPSSPHGLGIRAERKLADARKDFAEILGCRPGEIIFTSGGTESNNLAILGFALANKRRGVTLFCEPQAHPSVIEPIKFAAELGLAEIGDRRDLEGPSRGLRLVCLSHVSHETGDICNLAETAARLKRENPETVVFADGAQGFCKEFGHTGVDMYSFSGHKIHGAAGFGGLYSGVRLVPFSRGGGQENGLRSGTENLHGAIQTACAAKHLAANLEENHARVAAIKAALREIAYALPDVTENALSDVVSPYILNLSFAGIKGETLVHVLSENGIFASMGAACRSRKKQKSALEAMGFSKERAESAVRFSFSHLNTLEEAEIAKRVVIEKVSELRRILKRPVS